MKNTIKKVLCKDSFSKSETIKRAKIAIEKAAAPYILAVVISAPLAFLYDGIIFGLINIIEPTNNSSKPLINIKNFIILILLKINILIHIGNYYVIKKLYTWVKSFR